MITEPGIDVAEWLAQIERSRDLTREFIPRGGELTSCARAAKDLVAGLHAEMLHFRSLVDGAVSTADMNARQLAAILEKTTDQSAMVQRAASAVGELDSGAKSVAETAAALGKTTENVARATNAYDVGIENVLVGLEMLNQTIDSAHSFAASMSSGTTGITTFLARLRTISRQARLLGINAAIEAAHLGDVGAGFVIVADEIKRLATSTVESATSVGGIEKALHGASDRVVGAIRESGEIAQSLVVHIGSAQKSSEVNRAQLARLDAAIADVSQSASSQSVRLSDITQGVERSSHFADLVQRAAERAGKLDIRAQLESLRATITQYTLTTRSDSTATSDIDETLFEPVALEAARSLRSRVDVDQRELLSLINAISVAVARNTFEWKEIGTSLAGLRQEFNSTVIAIEETTLAATMTGEASTRMRAALQELRNGFSTSVQELERSLEAVTRVRETVRLAESYVVETTDAGERATTILELIDSISAETTLLSLNAAIEAAHAGEAGSGFGVIADEIRKLAETTLDATQQIGSVLTAVSTASGSMSATTSSAVALTNDVGDRTTRMQTAVDDLRVELETTLRDASEVAAIVEQQFAAIADVRSATTIALGRLDSDFSAVTDSRRLDLANLGMQAHALVAVRPLGTVAEEVRGIGFLVAQRMDEVFDAAIARGSIALADCFDTDYDELTGAKIAQLARLFDVSRVPVTGFSPAKFATRYDRVVEDGINAIIDEVVPLYPVVKAMFAVDLNGYCFGHYHECRQAWTGDYTVDLNHNRIKRFFEDELSLRCSRNGLGPESLGLPARTSRREFIARGCTLERTEPRPWAIYTYARDTGIVYNDLSVSLFAQNQRVGTIRIIYNADVI